MKVFDAKQRKKILKDATHALNIIWVPAFQLFSDPKYLHGDIYQRPFILVKVGLYWFLVKRHKWRLYKYTLR